MRRAPGPGRAAAAGGESVRAVAVAAATGRERVCNAARPGERPSPLAQGGRPEESRVRREASRRREKRPRLSPWSLPRGGCRLSEGMAPASLEGWRWARGLS